MDMQKIEQSCQFFSDKKLRETALKALKNTGYPFPDFQEGMDTSRQGLIDLIIGMLAAPNLADFLFLQVNTGNNGET